MQFIETGGVRPGCEVEGTGVSFVIPVSSSQQTIRLTLSPPIREYIQLIFVHHRGPGPSSRVPFPEITLAAIADDIDAVREHLGLERVGLLG
ncbi:MAG TPA: hypothetical protein DGB32_04740 [Dehalococcoidia bacterium]|jgi:pimeloyl-ACP methyl ester carboxylesterase|nr:hypothetical protein [Chloroflexota bacterium]HCV27611.1 hypothetical protein [Dehalococcoidia bacterium]